MSRNPCAKRTEEACKNVKETDCEWIPQPKGSLITSCREKKKVEEEDGSEKVEG